MVALLIAEILFKDFNILLKSSDFVPQDLLVITWALRMSVVLIIRLLKGSFKFSYLLSQIKDILSGLVSILFIQLLFIVSILFTIFELYSYSFQFIRKLLDNSSLFLWLKVVFCLSPIKLILSWLELAFKWIDVLIELINSFVIGFTISLESIGKRVDSSALLLTFLSSLLSHNIKLVFESINLSSKSKLSFFLSNFLFFFVSQ